MSVFVKLFNYIIICNLISLITILISGLGYAWDASLNSQQSVKHCHQLPSRLCGQHERWPLPKTDL